jgi:hypothetical protein
MYRYAVTDIITKKVVNIAVWDGVSEWEPGHELIAIRSDEAEKGWIWNGETFHDPMPPEQPPV